MIPKIIHLCWLSGDEFPEKIKYCIESWKKVLSDYEIMLWDFKRFDINESLWVRQAYESKKYAFAADYIRFYALYYYGGIYLDSDVEVIKSLDCFLDLPYFIGFEDAGNQHLEPAVMGAEKGLSWIRDCLDYYKDRDFIVDSKYDLKPLPVILGERIKSTVMIPDKKFFDYNIDDVIQAFPKTYFSPKEGVTGDLKFLSDKTYTIHHYAASWLPFVNRTYVLLCKVFSKRTVNYLSKLRKYIYKILGNG